jgi:capsular polysaccharide export protein
MSLASHQQGPELSRVPSGRGRLAAHAFPLSAEALAALFPEFAVTPSRDAPSTIAVWSGRPHRERDKNRARARATALGIPLLHLGCGVLRAPPRRADVRPLLSVTAQAIEGPSSPADILSPDRLLSTCGWETPALIRRAAVMRRELAAQQVGGDWWNDGELPSRADAFVLAEGPMCSASAGGAMLTAALAENPPKKIVVLGAPSRTRLRAFFETAAACGCTVVTAPIDPWQVIERARQVFTAGGETGFLALLAGCEVHCFGNSFYSGWGVTADDKTVVQRPFRRTVDEVFAGACLLATRCLDPYRNAAGAFEDVVAMLADWRRIEDANRRVAVCVGMSFWKRRRVTDFLRSAAGPPAFCRTTGDALAAASARPGSSIAVWASRAPQGLAEAAARQGTPLIRVEDGFVRSVGLGSDFMPAASLVLDRSGMHYDPRVRSDLERLLCEAEFSPALIERARNLIARLVARGITKYNLGSSAPAFEFPANRRRILVPGQVEDDLSVLLGGGGVCGNADLLARVRVANPDAFVVYKPHPDVEAGHRKGVVPDKLAKRFADTVVRSGSMAAILGEIDELHTLTSLTGFEALLRRRRVVVYGRPFYAGWGLTTDLAALDRGRRLTLEELVAGALILYPRYLDPVTRLPCTPEIVIERLGDPKLWRPGILVIGRRLQGILAQQWRALARTSP